MSLMLNTGAMQYKADGSSGWQPLTLVANVDLESLADAFSESATYEVGEYVRRDSRVYRCITAVTTAGAWDSTKWLEVTLADEIHDNYAELKISLDNAIIQSSGYAVTGNGTSGQLSLTGLTADHVVGNWGMFSDSACTTPIPVNAPTCDLAITTYSGYWIYTVENFTSTFYLKPTFIKD